MPPFLFANSPATNRACFFLDRPPADLVHRLLETNAQSPRISQRFTFDDGQDGVPRTPRRD